VTVAVTGSSGLLGGAVVAELEQASIDVLRLDIVDDGTGQTVILDLRDDAATLNAFDGCTGLVHTAGIPRPQGQSPADLFMTNTMINFNAAEGAVQRGLDSVVNISSISFLGYPFFVQPITPAYLPVDEQHSSAPQDAYALSKQVGEEIWAAAARRAAKPIQITNLRMPWIQTPSRFLDDIATATATGKDARNLWAYIDSRDAALAARLALDSGHQARSEVRTMFVSAADNFTGQPSATLVQQVWPDLACPIAADGSLISSALAQKTIGYRAAHSWRSYALNP